MNSQAKQIKEFFTAFNPTVDMRKLIREEFNEWFTETEAKEYAEANELKELCDLQYVIYGMAEQCGWDISANPIEVAKITFQVPHNRLDSVIVAAYGEWLVTKHREWLENMLTAITAYARIKKWRFDEAFNRVHTSNMSKLGADGKPIYREDGKVLKGPNYAPADLKDLINTKKVKSDDKTLAPKQKGNKGSPRKA